MRRLRPNLRTTFLAPGLALAAFLAACGGGGDDAGDGVASLSEGDSASGDDTTDTTLSEEEAEEALLDWAACMREQGIDMPDPQISDGGVAIQIGGPPGGGDEGEEDGGSEPPDGDAFEAAREECGDPPRIGGEFTEEDREEMEENALRFAECMRDEGVTDFPDPDFSDFGPGVGPQTRSSDDDSSDDDSSGGGGGSEPGMRVAGPFGELDLTDPEIRAAFEACQDEMGGPFGGRIATAPSGAASSED